jgi:hypothetical protein
LWRVKSLEWGGGQALEQTYLLKITSWQGHCELGLSLDAQSMISSSTTAAFSPRSILELGQDIQAVILVKRLNVKYPFNYDYASNIEENDLCCHLQLAHSW